MIKSHIENRLRIRKADRLLRNERALRGAHTALVNRLAHAGPKAAQIRENRH